MRKVIAAYTEAVRLDPKFALAWADLANTTGYLYFNGVEPELYTAESVKRAADTALQLQPRLAEAQLAQGIYRYRVLRDFAGAQQAFEAVQRSERSKCVAAPGPGGAPAGKVGAGPPASGTSGETRATRQRADGRHRRRNPGEHAPLRRGS
jgi:hypothetical protein